MFEPEGGTKDKGPANSNADPDVVDLEKENAKSSPKLTEKDTGHKSCLTIQIYVVFVFHEMILTGQQLATTLPPATMVVRCSWR